MTRKGHILIKVYVSRKTKCPSFLLEKAVSPGKPENTATNPPVYAQHRQWAERRCPKYHETD